VVSEKVSNAWSFVESPKNQRFGGNFRRHHLEGWNVAKKKMGQQSDPPRTGHSAASIDDESRMRDSVPVPRRSKAIDYSARKASHYVWSSYEVRRVNEADAGGAIHLQVTPVGPELNDFPLGLQLSEGVFDIVGEFLAELVREERDGGTTKLLGQG
jgi:hypothetical protein